MKDYCIPYALPVGMLDQPFVNRGQNRRRHALGLKAPGGVRPLIHVAVRAIDIAAARGLQKNRVELALDDHVVSYAGQPLSAPVVPMVNAVVSRVDALLVSDLFQKSGQYRMRRIVDGRVCAFPFARRSAVRLG